MSVLARTCQRQPRCQQSYLENRLHVRDLTVWLMGVSLVLLMCLGILVLFLRPTDVVPKDPDPSLAMCTILASRIDLGRLLQGKGHV